MVTLVQELSVSSIMVHTHERIQNYLLEMNLLICDEVPLLNEEYNIQGHTDGFLDLPEDEVAILEIKSINDNQFNQLKDAKEEHKKQGLIYLYCAEERRQQLRSSTRLLRSFMLHKRNVQSIIVLSIST